MIFVTIGNSIIVKPQLLYFKCVLRAAAPAHNIITYYIPRSIKSAFEWVVGHSSVTYGFLKHFDTKIIYI